MEHHIGIDLGGTKTEGILVDSDFNVITRNRVQTPENYDEILSSICTLVEELKIDNSTIGICTPGALSEKTGLIKNSNTACLIGKNIKQDLEDALEQKVSIENDANCFGLAEARMGAARGYSVVFGVILGTGVGGGIIIDGKIHQGANHIAGEWGHHILYPGGNECYCGKRGCTETYISGPALERRWQDIAGSAMPLASIVKQSDSDNLHTWKKEFLDNFGYGLANVIDILDPDAIVLGGGVSNVDFLYTQGRDSVYDKVFSDHIKTPILKNQLGDSAGVFGACMI